MLRNFHLKSCDCGRFSYYLTDKTTACFIPNYLSAEEKPRRILLQLFTVTCAYLFGLIHSKLLLHLHVSMEPLLLFTRYL